MTKTYEPIEIEHVRRPDLPWRPATRTECGLAISNTQAISRDELIEKAKAMGDMRCRLTTCGTCVDTFQRYPAWEDDPVRSMGREIAWSTRWSRHREPDEKLFERELRAMAALVARHRAEFDELLEDQEQVVALSVRRKEAARERRHLPPKW